MHSLSVALCTYNGARFLDEQMRTLREQAGVAEIVAVDDASTDETWTILRSHAGQDARIRLFRNKVQLGVTGNFERAIRLVRGEWVALADQDDIWLPDKLARLRAAWDGGSCLMHHATRKFRGDVPPASRFPAGERRKFSGSDVRRLLYRNSIVGHTVLMRADMARSLAPFPRGVPHDWWLGVGAAVLGRVQYVDEHLVHYRIHARNAFHAAGSRWRRSRAEHGLRLELLQALTGWQGLSGPAGVFVQTYRRLLEQSERGTFPWALWRFYLRHASLFFGGGSDLSPIRRIRKSSGAALGAMWRTPQTGPGEVWRRVLPAEPAVRRALRQTG
jgi:glycosyltransferase involved in cell wall biosynthesis